MKPNLNGNAAKLFAVIFMAIVCMNSGFAQSANEAAPVDTGHAEDGQALVNALESPEAVAKRLEWWKDARFGMFIHWGLYAQEGCHWQGRDGKTEHMMRHLELPLAEYAKIADVFNPTEFDADEWVRIAKDAGMKYMIITSKHHDGFAMYDAKSSDYNVVKKTPWGRDPIKELNEACGRAGLKFGVYYSLGRDWEDPDVPTDVKPNDGKRRSNTWDFPDEDKKDFTKYFERKVKPQITELMTQYQPAVMWFDTPEKISKAQSEELIRLIRSINPDTIINARVGNRLGDYAVQEQKIPEGGDPQPWETCMTLNNHWGYYLGDENWKPVSRVVQNIVDIVSKGGNYLLNVGPTGKGVIPQGSQDALAKVGEWMRVNGEAIYGTHASPIGQPAWGRVTQKAAEDGTNLYLHVFEWPKDGKLAVSGLKNEVVSATVLAGGETLKTEAVADGVVINVPAAAPDPNSSTIVLKVKGKV